jgi:hypothetical protein
VWPLLALVAIGEASAAPPWRGRPTGSRTDFGEPRRTLPPRLNPAATPPLDARRQRGALARVARLRPDLSANLLAGGFGRYRDAIQRIRRVARDAPDAVAVRRVGQVEGLSILRIDLRPASRVLPARRPRVLIVGGVHAGTEEVGWQTATAMIERLAADRAARDAFDVTVVPLLSPGSLVADSRTDLARRDVNRSFGKGASAEAAVIERLVTEERFDLVLDLHAASLPGRNGFFLIREGDDRGMSQRILTPLGSNALLDVPGASGRPATVGPYTLDHLGATVSSNTGTLKTYVAARGVPYVYTVEAPGGLDLVAQIRGMQRIVWSAMHNVRRHGRLAPRAPRAQ